jgi:hypothetical protein
MSAKDNTDCEEQYGEDEYDGTDPEVPFVTHHAGPALHAEPRSDDKRKIRHCIRVLHGWWRWCWKEVVAFLDRYGAWGLFKDAATIAIAAFAVFIYFRQWRAMQETSNQAERTAILAIGQMVIANGNAKAAEAQAQAAADSVKTLREQFQLGERPLMVVTCCEVGDLVGGAIPPTIGKTFGVNIKINNTGKSPAYHYNVHAHLLWGEDVEKIRTDGVDQEQAQAMLPPGGPGIFVTAITAKDTYHFDPGRYTSDEVTTWNGDQPLIVFGRVTYDDTLGGHYCTQFTHLWLHDQVWANTVESVLKNTKTSALLHIPNMCPPSTHF